MFPPYAAAVDAAAVRNRWGETSTPTASRVIFEINIPRYFAVIRRPVVEEIQSAFVGGIDPSRTGRDLFRYKSMQRSGLLGRGARRRGEISCSCGQGNPPPPVDLLECLPDLQGSKILQADWAVRKECDHEPIAHAAGASVIVRCEAFRFGHPCEAGFHQSRREDQAVQFRSRLHHEREILLDLGEPGEVDRRRKQL